MNRRSLDFLSLVSSEVARRILGFIAVAYLARTLSVAEFGLINIAFTILSYTIIVSTAGLNVFGIKETARQGPNAAIGTLISLRLVIAAVVFVVTSIACIILIADPLAVKLV